MSVGRGTNGEFSRTTNLPSNAAGWTVCFWLRLIGTHATVFECAFAFDEPVANYLSINVDPTTTQVKIYSSNGLGQNIVDPGTNTWVFVALKITAATSVQALHRLEAAGSLTNSGALTCEDMSAGTKLWIMNDVFGEPATQQQLYNFKMWNAALSDAEILAESNSVAPVRTSNIDSWMEWRNSTAGTDLSGNGRNWTVGGTPGNIAAYPVVAGRTAAALTGTGTLALNGTQTAALNAALTGTGTLAATGRAQANTAAALTGTGTLAAAGRAQANTAAALTGTGTLAATGRAQANTAAALSGVGTLAAAGRALANTAAALSGVGTLTAALSGGGVLNATLTAVGTLAAAGRSLANTAAALVGSGTLTAAGSAQANTAAALSGVGTLSAVGRAQANTAAALSGVGTLTGTLSGGVVPTPGAPVKDKSGRSRDRELRRRFRR